MNFDPAAPAVGQNVVIRAAAAGSTAGVPHVPAVGVITHCPAPVLESAQHQDLAGMFHVAREDGAVGGAPGGAWAVASASDLEPVALPLGSRVQVVTWATHRPEWSHNVTSVMHTMDGDLYGLDGGPAEYPRLSLELAEGLPTARPVEEETRAEDDCALAATIESLDREALPQPARVPEMLNWHFDMRRPLNHGARFPTNLPNDSEERKKFPLGQVLFGQFGAAMIDLARHSWEGNNKHNPDQALQDARNKSNDDLDCALRHLAEGDYRGAHWRVARLHQKQLEAEGAPVAPLATFG